MGRDVPAIVVSYADRRRYREKVRRCLDVFARMLRESRFTDGTEQVGLEVEFNLVDGAGYPFMRNAEVLNAIANDAFQTELGQFNIEINVRPRGLQGQAAADLETFRAHCARTRQIMAAHQLDDTFGMENSYTLRWFYLYLIKEYARHLGHADLLRERIDGATGE